MLQRSRRWCPGVAWYVVGCAPKGLLTFSQLKRRGLRPRERGAPDGCIVTAYGELVYLYAVDQALPRHGETEKQRAARLAAWPRIQEKYKCAHCGYLPASLSAIRYDMSGPGLCISCKASLEWQAEQDALEAQIARDRRDVCRWAYQLLQRADWALIDTETTSLVGLVCEIAVVAGDSTILFHSLVNPQRPVTAEAREIHGISDEELAAAPTLPEIWPALQEALRDRTTLVAYNASFDRAATALWGMPWRRWSACAKWRRPTSASMQNKGNRDTRPAPISGSISFGLHSLLERSTYGRHDEAGYASSTSQPRRNLASRRTAFKRRDTIARGDPNTNVDLHHETYRDGPPGL